MGDRIGIMGGTFNPIHNGHLLLAETAREYLKLDRVLFMPSGNPYMKNVSSILNGELRAEMIQLAIQENPFFAISKMELEREGPTYTWETLYELRKNNPEDRFFFLMGADSLFMVESWKRPEYILKNCIIVVAVRGSNTPEQIKEMINWLTHKYQADIRILPSGNIDISSSDIRAKLKNGNSVRYMLPDRVLTYINEKGLYNLESRSDQIEK